jgi:hypothetical protein
MTPFEWLPGLPPSFSTPTTATLPAKPGGPKRGGSPRTIGKRRSPPVNRSGKRQPATAV